ncbi:hypothetical protein HJFPF1_13162 [Paramyrothecium foliicola]|nr:hypothetical protein HJFPF1_13162 [Paramyrothecium foliicola]
MSASDNAGEWKGPSTEEMIRTRTLGKMIIEHQDGPTPVFDDDELLVLKRFVENPAQAKSIPHDYEAQDNRDDKPGAEPQSKRGLAGYVVATYGTEQSALTDDDVVALHDWFAQGNGKISGRA